MQEDATSCVLNVGPQQVLHTSKLSRNGAGEEQKRERALKQSSRFHPSPASVWSPSRRVLIALQ